MDKTAFALQLFNEGKSYFLSRPRRFGKSLFLSTLVELFSGSRELFEGLYVHDRWDWSTRWPVLRLDFADARSADLDVLREDLGDQLGTLERVTDLKRHAKGEPGRLRDLILGLHQRTAQRVVLLIDEYDKPILDVLGHPEIARANRAYLRSLYAVIKSCDAHLRFCFLTGVSKFSKVSLFSGLNNLRDITLTPAYSAICGFTERDLDTVFGAELEGLDRERVRKWYNGYSWGGTERVYNPFDALLLFAERRFKSWWFETGTPTFLIETLVERQVQTAELQGMLASERLLSTFDVGSISTEALLFQSGYLTLAAREEGDNSDEYRLRFPNHEVRMSLHRSVVDGLVGNPSEREKISRQLRKLLQAADLDGLEVLLRSHFAKIPYQWHTANPIRHYEGYYASVFCSYLSGLDQAVVVEDSSSQGRVDMTVLGYGRVYLFEFKVVEQSGAGAALKQLRARGYADKYRHLGQPIHLVGVEFSEATRNLERFDTGLA